MDRKSLKAALKSRLLKDVAYLCRRVDRRWSEPIVKTLRDFRESQAKAVFFGGTLRSLLVSRLRNRGLGRPRDLDIVVAGATIDDLKQRFAKIISRETRFGGLQLRQMNWQFDVWPLQRTWAFVHDHVVDPEFSALPATTFFNLEAIAVDVWPARGRARQVYSGNDQFYEGLLAQTLEINREDNPFPSLCVVRAIVIASAIDFAIGPRLARYLCMTAPGISNDELEAVQIKHYGRLVRDTATFRTFLDHVARSHDKSRTAAIKLPMLRQMTFWADREEPAPTLNIRVIVPPKMQ